MKEKVNDLIDKFMQPVDKHHKYPMCFDTAKQCALISIEEIINTLNSNNDISYWQEVKQELNKTK